MLMKHLWKRDVSEEEMTAVGERVWNLGRLFNLREGYTRADDTVPEAWLEKPFTDGVSAGKTIGTARFNEVLGQYYALRGWDEDGVPTEAKLTELGIDVRL